MNFANLLQQIIKRISGHPILGTDHLHVHVAINKEYIRQTFKILEPYYDQKRHDGKRDERLEENMVSSAIIASIKVNHTEAKQRINPTQSLNNDQPERDSRFRRYLQKSYDLQITEKPEGQNLQQFAERCPAAIWRHERAWIFRYYCRAMHVVV